MSAKLQVPPLPYTMLAIALAHRDLHAAAVILLSVTADNMAAAKERNHRVPQVAQATARRSARQS